MIYSNNERNGAVLGILTHVANKNMLLANLKKRLARYIRFSPTLPELASVNRVSMFLSKLGIKSIPP